MIVVCLSTSLTVASTGAYIETIIVLLTCVLALTKLFIQNDFLQIVVHHLMGFVGGAGARLVKSESMEDRRVLVVVVDRRLEWRQCGMEMVA